MFRSLSQCEQFPKLHNLAQSTLNGAQSLNFTLTVPQLDLKSTGSLDRPGYRASFPWHLFHTNKTNSVNMELPIIQKNVAVLVYAVNSLLSVICCSPSLWHTWENGDVRRWIRKHLLFSMLMTSLYRPVLRTFVSNWKSCGYSTDVMVSGRQLFNVSCQIWQNSKQKDIDLKRGGLLTERPSNKHMLCSCIMGSSVATSLHRD